MNAEMLLMRLRMSQAPSVNPKEIRTLLTHIDDLESLVGSLLGAITEAKVRVDVPFKEKTVLRTYRPTDDEKTWGDESA